VPENANNIAHLIQVDVLDEEQPPPHLNEGAPRTLVRSFKDHFLGLPLHNPGPDARLSIECRRLGISIGDVGMITGEGGFDYLFNICRQNSDPLNPEGSPAGVQPLSESTLGISRTTSFFPNDYITSQSVEKCTLEGEGCGLY
jgi:hypothetical protein